MKQNFYQQRKYTKNNFLKYLSHGGIDMNNKKFKLYIRPDFPQEDQPIGHFYRNDKIDDYVMVIWLNTTAVVNANMREAFVEPPTKEQKVSFMIVTKDFAAKLKARKKEALFVVYHELGHVCCGFTKKYHNQDEIRRARRNAIKKGEVMKDELNADAFAARYLGKKNALYGLKMQMDSRKKRDEEHGVSDTIISKLAIQEYINRISAIEKIID